MGVGARVRDLRIVQAWVPLASGLDARVLVLLLAAIAIAKSLFAKGASAASALAFQFASTNLVWELGLVLWVLIGWQFTLAEYVGGIVMIVLMTGLLRLFVSRQLETEESTRGRPTPAISTTWPASSSPGASG